MNHSQWPYVSVIIAARNAESVLLKQLNALAAQQDAPPFEVIISDNGSTDGTAALAKQWAQGDTGAVSSLRVIDSSARKGISYARTLGALEAKGQLLAYCDSDDVVRPGWVAALAAAVTSGMGGGRLFAVLPDGTRDDGVFTNTLRETSYLPFASGASFAVTKEAFLALGGYDLSYPPYGGEDVELSWRLQEAGYPLVYVPEAELDYTVALAPNYYKRFFIGVTWGALYARHPKAAAVRKTGWSHVKMLGTQLSAAVARRVSRIRVGNEHLAQPHLSDEHLTQTPPKQEQAVQPSMGRKLPPWALYACQVAGRIYGYWAYGIRRKPTEFLIAPKVQSETQQATVVPAQAHHRSKKKRLSLGPTLQPLRSVFTAAKLPSRQRQLFG